MTLIKDDGEFVDCLTCSNSYCVSCQKISKVRQRDIIKKGLPFICNDKACVKRALDMDVQCCYCKQRQKCTSDTCRCGGECTNCLMCKIKPVRPTAPPQEEVGNSYISKKFKEIDDYSKNCRPAIKKDIVDTAKAWLKESVEDRSSSHI